MSGVELARRFYAAVVAPLLSGRPHAAALLGEGSEVLGFDDATSIDHDFGPRVQIFGADPAAVRALEPRLPVTFEGLPVAFSYHGSAVQPHLYAGTGSDYFIERLGFDPAGGVTTADWLRTPTQILAALTGGAVFHDPDGELARRRAALRWYPDDVWRYALAAGWRKVGQEEPFVARAAAAGDDLGARLIAARLARELARLAFLVERRWAPYAKWLGSGVARLELAGSLGPALAAAVAADRRVEREEALLAAAVVVATATNDLGLAPPVDPAPRPFFDRDIRVLGADRFTDALTGAVTDPGLRALIDSFGTREDVPRLPGTIDQAVDNTDVLTNPARCRAAGPMLGL